MQALSLGLRAPYRLKRWVTLLAQASLRLDFTRGAPLDSRVTFTRASGGTSFRPVGYGPNLVANGDFSGGKTPWDDYLATSTITSGELIHTSNGGHTYQPLATVVGKIYVVTAVVRKISGGDAYIAAQDGADAYLIRGESQRVASTTAMTVTLQFVAGNALTNIQCRSAATGGVAGFDNIFVQEVTLDRPGDPIQLFTAPANVPRFDFDPATGACKGLLIEEQRTNLATASSDFTGATVGWSAGSNWTHISRQGNQLTALGLPFTAISISTTGQSAWMGTDVASASVGEKFSVSILAKAKSVSNHYALSIRGAYPRRVDAVFNLLTGAVVFSGANTWTDQRAKATPLGDGVWRLELTGTNQAADNVNMFHGPCEAGGAGGWEGGRSILCDAYITAAQFERGHFPTSLIPTSGAAATRAADVASVNTLSPWFNSAEGTLFAEFDGLNSSAKVVQFNPVAVGSFLTLANAGGPQNGWYANGLSVTGHHGVGTNNKSAVVYAPNGVVAASINAGAVASSTSSDFTGAATSLALGNQGGGAYLNGHIRRIAYIPRRLSNLDLQGLTR